MKALWLLPIVLTCACGGSLIAPAPSAVIAPRLTPTRALALDGQSNALMLAPFLRTAYPLPVLMAGQSGEPIDGWAVGSPNAAALLALVAQPVQALVWWQGESDRNTPDYLDRLRELMARVRAASGDPRLLIIEVRVLDLPVNANVRAAQEAFAVSDVNAALVSSDGFENGASDHLTDAGYQAVTQRILDALR